MEREKIKNALSKSDLNTLLKIVKCYTKDNGLTPIYENCADSIKELRDCGYTVDEVQIQDFAFLTPNRYGGVSGSNELGIDIETELVPYVEANYTTYAKDLHIDDNISELKTAIDKYCETIKKELENYKDLGISNVYSKYIKENEKNFDLCLEIDVEENNGSSVIDSITFDSDGSYDISFNKDKIWDIKNIINNEIIDNYLFYIIDKNSQPHYSQMNFDYTLDEFDNECYYGTLPLTFTIGFKHYNNNEADDKDEVNDSNIQDATEFNLDWLKKNWKKTIGHTDRFANLVGIAEKVAREDDELSEKLLTIARKYDAEPKRYTYNWAKEEFFNVFRNNKKDPKPVVSEEDQNKMKVAAKETYEKFSGKKVDKYANLPEDWQKALTPLIESERKEAFKFELNKLTGKEDDDAKITEALKKDFEKIFGFEATEENIKKFGYKEEENGDEMLDCIKATFQAVKNKKIDYLIAVKFFEKVKTYPNKYLFFSEDWYEKPMTEEEKESSEAKKRQAERKSDLEVESSNESIQKKKDEINEKASILKNSGNEEWINYWETDFQALKNMFKRGEYTEEEFYDELLESLDYCLEKAGLKKSVNEKIEQEYQKNLSVIKNHVLYDYNDTRDAFEKFLDNLNYENKVKFVRLLSNALDKQELKNEDFAGMTEDEAYKFFEIFKKNKNVKQSLEQLKAQESEEKESE